METIFTDNATWTGLQPMEVGSNVTVRHEWTRKINLLCLSLWFPLSMSRYFEKALRHNDLLDVKTVGPYTGNWIPWSNAQNPTGMNLPMKYAIPPDIPLPFTPDVGRVNFEYVHTLLNGWEPDIILTIDAGICWADKPKYGVVAHVATDPHVLNYDHQRKISDYFFNMQKCYSEPSDIYLPYAYSKYDHFPEPNEQDLDAVLVGLQYTHVPRVQWIEELRKLGVSVFTENGPVFDEYRAIANRALIGLNWPTMNDLNARFFEHPAFGLASVAKRVPDAPLFLEDGVDYLGFDTLPEAIEKVMCLKKDPEYAQKIALSGYEKIKPHTYNARVDQILKTCGYI